MKTKDETPGNAELKFALNGKALEIKIEGKLLDYINDNNPYVIDEIGIWFEPDGSLQLPNNLEAIRIEIDADIQYKHTF